MQGFKRKKIVMTRVCVQKYFSILKAEFPEVFSKSFIVKTEVLLVRARCQGIYEKWNVFLVNSYIFGFSYSLIIWKPI